MEDIPQPANEPYSVGDRVQAYIGPDDPDSRFHGEVCEILKVHADDLGAETGRNLDDYSYTLEKVESAEQLPIHFRHHDLVPTENTR